MRRGSDGVSTEKRRMSGTKERKGRLCFQPAVASCPQSNA